MQHAAKAARSARLAHGIEAGEGVVPFAWGQLQASIRALPGIDDAVRDSVEVLLDGGIRRRSDVVKALTMGARAVMIGRVYLWGMAVGGQQGVHNVIEILRNGIDSALLGLSKASVHELDRDDLVVPLSLARLGGGIPIFSGSAIVQLETPVAQHCYVELARSMASMRRCWRIEPIDLARKEALRAWFWLASRSSADA